MTSGPAQPSSIASATLDEVLSGLAGLGQIEAWTMSDDELAALARGLDRAARLVEAQSMRIAAEAGSRGLPGKAGHTGLAGWMREQTPGLSPRVAAARAGRTERLFTSAVAAELAPTRAALLEGSICAGHADVVASMVQSLVPPAAPAGLVPDDALAAAQAFLLHEAAHFDPSQLKRLGDHLRHRLDPDADDRLTRDEHATRQRRGLTLASTNDGMVHLEGLLTARAGAAVRTAIDAASAPQPATDGTPDPRTAAQRRHDALHHLADTMIGTDQLPSTHGSPYRVVVDVPWATLRGGSTGTGGSPGTGGAPAATLADGTALSRSTLDEILCGAEVVPVLTDPMGNPLDVGRTQRLFTPKQRQALAHRDRGCTYPRCGAPVEWSHAHHLVPYSGGGRTDLSNGALLCGRHHRQVHAAGHVGRVDARQVVWDIGPPGGRPQHSLTAALRLLDRALDRWRGAQLCEVPPTARRS
jgi:hypothetical protein